MSTPRTILRGRESCSVNREAAEEFFEEVGGDGGAVFGGGADVVDGAGFGGEGGAGGGDGVQVG